MDFFVTPYRICTCIFIRSYCRYRVSLGPRENGTLCMFILDLIGQSECTFKQLNEMIEAKCESTAVIADFRKDIRDTIVDINNLFEITKQMRECPDVDNQSVAGLYLRKVSVYFERLTHKASSNLYDDLTAWVSSASTKRHKMSVSWQTPRTTRSSGASSVSSVDQTKPPAKTIHHINHEISRLQANEQRAMNPKDLYESIRRPVHMFKSDATFLRYLNLLRVNEYCGSKHLLVAYFDMVSETVSRSYSSLNYAIWYLHHHEYKRAIECLQECYCCAQAADDDKCLLIALMWLARIVIQAKQKFSSKYNVTELLELLRKRSHKANMPYVEAMAAMTLEQLMGPVDDSEQLKKSSATLKQVALNSRHPNHLLANANQPNPLDKDDILPTAEILAVRNSMNDVLAMYYALLSAHLNLLDFNQSAALASQTLLHFDLIEKCGEEDVFIVNENTLIAIRNLAFHVWNSTRNIQLVREMLLDLCSSQTPTHRTDNQAICRQAWAEMSFEYFLEQENWSEAMRMIDVLRETDQAGAQLLLAELLRYLNCERAQEQVDDLIERLELEESDLDVHSADLRKTSRPSNCDGKELSDPLPEPRHFHPSHLASKAASDGPVEATAFSYLTEQGSDDDDAISRSGYIQQSSLSIEHMSFIKSKALLLSAKMRQDGTKLLEALDYASENGFQHVKTACLMEFARQPQLMKSGHANEILNSIAIEVFANGTLVERRDLNKLLAFDGDSH